MPDITITEHTNDGGGRPYRPGQEVAASDRLAEIFIARGVAVLTVDIVAQALAKFEGGLLVTRETDRDLVNAAKRAGVRTARARGVGV